METWRKILVRPDATVREALLKIDAAGTQMALVVGVRGELLGTLSDGDIRRGLIKGMQLSDAIQSCMCVKPMTVGAHESREAALGLMRRQGLHQVPVVDANNVVVGLEVVGDFLTTRSRDNWVVVMAGGPGTRLKELTHTTPKPMLRIGNRPLLETILRNFINQGFSRFYLAVNYKAEVIEDHFGDGTNLGAEIQYVRESRRMGTAGALGLLPEKPTSPILVTNGDLLVKIDYGEMLDMHIRAAAVATMAVRDYEFQIPYGVIQERDGRIRNIEEKPILRSLVSAGIYVLSPEALDLVPRDSFLDMPTLFGELMAKGIAARCHAVDGYWLDIGRPPDFEKANDDYSKVFE